MKKLIILLVILIVFYFLWNAASIYFPQYFPALTNIPLQKQTVKVVTEEDVTINAVKEVGPSVVTVIEESTSAGGAIRIGPFQIFNLPNQNQEPESRSIGSGFIVQSDGLIVTNKHVVSDIGTKYQISTSNNKTYDVKNIYRDPLNDIAILKIDPSDNKGNTLRSVVMGDSSKLQVGQFVVAIGTALGEFKNTVTTGVISGLGRGITAGDIYQGYAEKLDNVIQTDAAINPGNSGGPLVNSVGEVIGINTAIAQGGQNIGFALPINAVKESLNNFNKGGQFNRPYLGVSYNMITKEVAIQNNVVEGAYVGSIVKDSPAEKAGIQTGDIITKFNGKNVTGKGELATLIAEKKPGDKVGITVWRDGETQNLSATLTTAPSQ
ncbi:MAG: hypothetical protein A2W22_02325 [Candidatus Levybacteria bacterium RBG_16_35_11]|nr:MAG: hypothetical protein A2W22_02325 [Candidatus Levybacteria bacterium RBG_16_35_11]